MSYQSQLELTKFIADIEIAVKGCTLMSFVAFMCYNYNIINKIPKVNTYRYHTIKNNYSIV